MFTVRLLQGADYSKTYDDYAGCLGFCGDGESPEVQARKAERSDFFCQLQEAKRGGILIAEDEMGRVVGWFSFLDKVTAEQILWPCRRENGALNRLVGGCLLVNHELRGQGIGCMLAIELRNLAQEWGYQGVEVACRNDDPYDPELNWHTPTPFKHAGYEEAERYHCERMYPADFIIMECLFKD